MPAPLAISEKNHKKFKTRNRTFKEAPIFLLSNIDISSASLMRLMEGFEIAYIEMVIKACLVD